MKDSPFADWAIGCLVQIAALILCFVFLTENDCVWVCAYAIILSPVALVVRLLMHNADLDGIWTRLLGPVFFAGAVLLGCFAKLDTGKGEPEDPQTPPEVAATNAPPAAGGGEAGEGETELPPGIRYTPPEENSATVEEALAELDSLIGLGEVKEEVRKFTSFIRVAQQRQAAGLKVAPVSYHMVFTGNPGTGKTTVARIMAKVYRALGIVEKGQLVETDRGGLIGEYVGQTAVKTGKVIDCALGGVLFIDEAYSIVDGRIGGYGAECIATLLKRMEDDRDQLVVIIAGYPDEMKRFIDANPGLQSRFNRYIHFPDYSAAELAAIFRLNARKSQYVLSDDAERWLEPALRVWTRKRDRTFGNGRYVRNLFEKAVENHAMRLAGIENPTKEVLMTLTPADIGIPPEGVPEPIEEEAGR